MEASDPRDAPSARSARKHADIVQAAQSLFLEQGYGATSMDAVAAASAASKRTVYNHFSSKQELFRAVVQSLYREIHGAVAPLTVGGCLRDELTQFADALLVHMGRPQLRALIRLVIAEHTRFPEITGIYFETGKEPAVSRLTAWITAETAAGRLVAAHPVLAAQQFLGCLKETLFWPRLLGLQSEYPPATVVEEAVSSFLTRYAVVDQSTGQP